MKKEDLERRIGETDKAIKRTQDVMARTNQALQETKRILEEKNHPERDALNFQYFTMLHQYEQLETQKSHLKEQYRELIALRASL